MGGTPIRDFAIAEAATVDNQNDSQEHSDEQEEEAPPAPPVASKGMFVFKYDKHYFIHFPLSNWTSVYYATEKKQKAIDWRVAQRTTNRVAVNAPIQFENIFGIFFTKNANIVT